MEKESICMRIDKNDLEFIKSYSRQESVKLDKDVSYTDLIRSLVKKFISEVSNVS